MIGGVGAKTSAKAGGEKTTEFGESKEVDKVDKVDEVGHEVVELLELLKNLRLSFPRQQLEWLVELWTCLGPSSSLERPLIAWGGDDETTLARLNEVSRLVYEFLKPDSRASRKERAAVGNAVERITLFRHGDFVSRAMFPRQEPQFNMSRELVLVTNFHTLRDAIANVIASITDADTMMALVTFVLKRICLFKRSFALDLKYGAMKSILDHGKRHLVVVEKLPADILKVWKECLSDADGGEDDEGRK